MHHGNGRKSRRLRTSFPRLCAPDTARKRRVFAKILADNLRHGRIHLTDNSKRCALVVHRNSKTFKLIPAAAAIFFNRVKRVKHGKVLRRMTGGHKNRVRPDSSGLATLKNKVRMHKRHPESRKQAVQVRQKLRCDILVVFFTDNNNIHIAVANMTVIKTVKHFIL